ncbi:hypothetical protein D3874_04570 [Oleomonas cavernae]|uniref:Uncharacterized protein n=1 Tax=Oleomonas cavernae TaxID=2320859 RepID=A0A418W8S0_9PROT|nr:hypothetical protein D3874_04570 [Oleomonas cavernae]
MKMAVATMLVGTVRVAEPQGAVMMPVAVGLTGRDIWTIIALMVGIMGVAGLVRQRATGAPMLVLFRQMEVDTHYHHQPGRGQRPRDRIAQDDDRLG